MAKTAIPPSCLTTVVLATVEPQWVPIRRFFLEPLELRVTYHGLQYSSTSGMAADVIMLLEYVGWTAPHRQLHIVSILERLTCRPFS